MTKKKNTAKSIEHNEIMSVEGLNLDKTQLKSFALSMLEATERLFNGKILPNIAFVSRLLNIPETTLSKWWKDRDEYYRLQGAVSVQLPLLVSNALSVEAMQIIAELRRRGYRNFSNRDLLNAIKTTTTLQRLLSGKSTSNVAHNVSFTPIHPNSSKIPGKKLEPAILIDEPIDTDEK